jgi:hypothetical protein
MVSREHSCATQEQKRQTESDERVRYAAKHDTSLLLAARQATALERIATKP